MTESILWGATGHARVLAECLSHQGIRVVALFDNNANVVSPLAGVPLYYGIAGFTEWLAGRHDLLPGFLVAIGGDRGQARLEIQDRLRASGLHSLTAIHPTAFVAADAEVGAGCHILANACVGVGASLGEQTIINTNASVDHECRVGKGVHIAPGATLCGCITVGDGVMIGAGAVVLPWLTIGNNVVVGAGSVVTRSLPDNIVAWGNPARVQHLKSP